MEVRFRADRENVSHSAITKCAIAARRVEYVLLANAAKPPPYLHAFGFPANRSRSQAGMVTPAGFEPATCPLGGGGIIPIY